MNRYLEIAEDIVRKAGREIKGMASYSGVKTQKPGGDLVTDGDLQVDRFVIDALSKAFPSHGFYSEERKEREFDNEFVWVLDPIDGTKYFSKEIPLYAISLALQHKEELIAGIVYSPEVEQMFTAEAGKRAMLNGEIINCSDQGDLSLATVCVEIPSRHAIRSERDWALDKVRLLIDNSQRTRIIGVSSVGLCWTAMGGFDAYVNLGSASRFYDIAAGLFILKQAGGVYTRKEGKMVAGPPQLHEKLIDLLEF